MKRVLLLLVLIGLPSLGFAKYCPTCLQTFQIQTVRGQSELLYRWMMTALRPENTIYTSVAVWLGSIKNSHGMGHITSFVHNSSARSDILNLNNSIQTFLL